MGTVSAEAHMKLKVGMTDLLNRTRSLMNLLQLMRETFNSVYTYTVVNVSYRTGVSIMGGSVRHLADRVKAEAGDLSEEVERAQGMMEQLKKEKEG